MAKRQFILTEQEVMQLKGIEDTLTNTRELRRFQAVRMYGTGYPVAEIEALTGCSWRALMDWCQAYRKEGVPGLRSKWQGDNALKLSREQRAELKTRLEYYQPNQVIAPDLRVEQGQFWTVSDLRIVVEQWYAVTYRSDSSYQRLLRECRFSQQQTQNEYRSRPNEQEVADFEARLEKK